VLGVHIVPVLIPQDQGVHENVGGRPAAARFVIRDIVPLRADKSGKFGLGDLEIHAQISEKFCVVVFHGAQDTHMNNKSQEKNPLMDIILIEMQRRGWNTMNLSKESGVAQPVISRFLNGSINIKVKNIFNLLKGLDLLSGTSRSLLPADFTLIPKYQARLSGGPGHYVLSQDIESHLSFKNSWLSGRCQKDQCALFEVRGDSMAPLITDGDIVLVNLSKNDPRDLIDGKIYAFSEGDTVKVKRLVWRGPDLWAISENKAEAPDAAVDKDGFNLIGKVVWVGHEVR
jgi:SOS-response transcriptional repressor LexA